MSLTQKIATATKTTTTIIEWNPESSAQLPVVRLRPAPPSNKVKQDHLKSTVSTASMASMASVSSMESKSSSALAPPSTSSNFKPASTSKQGSFSQQHRLSLSLSSSGSSFLSSTIPCTCSICEPLPADVLRFYHDRIEHFLQPLPPSPRLSTVATPLPLATVISKHAVALHQSNATVEDIVRVLHSHPELVVYRHRITPVGVWDALRQGMGKNIPEKNVEPPIVIGSDGTGELGDTPVLLAPTGKRFDALCLDYWFNSDMSVLEIARAVSRHGFGVPASPASVRDRKRSSTRTAQVGMKEVSEAHVLSALAKRGVKGGQDLGAEGMKGYCQESSKIIRYGFDLGMGIETAVEYVREQGYGGVRTIEVKREWRLCVKEARKMREKTVREMERQQEEKREKEKSKKHE